MRFERVYLLEGAALPADPYAADTTAFYPKMKKGQAASMTQEVVDYATKEIGA